MSDEKPNNIVTFAPRIAPRPTKSRDLPSYDDLVGFIKTLTYIRSLSISFDSIISTDEDSIFIEALQTLPQTSNGESEKTLRFTTTCETVIDWETLATEPPDSEDYLNTVDISVESIENVLTYISEVDDDQQST